MLVEFAKNLESTNVHTIDLSYNNIRSAAAVDFAKGLQGAKVHTVNLSMNNIDHKARQLLKKQYAHIKWKF